MIEIIQGDCLEVMRGFDDGQFDLLYTDPPYEFINKNPVGGGFMNNENKRHLYKVRDSFGMSFSPKPFLNETLRVIKPFNAYVWTNKTLLIEYIQFAERNGFKWDILVWRKPNPVPINNGHYLICLLYTSPSPRDRTRSRMPSSA